MEKVVNAVNVTFIIRSIVRLLDLVRDVPGATLVQGDPAAEVRGVVHDSRRVQPGELFVVIPGERHDARAYVPQALERGALGVVADAPLDVPPDRALLVVPAARPALADLSAALRGHPSRHLRLVGVTGTDGKTSTTRLLAAILDRAGQRTGWLTTVDVKIGDEIRPNTLDHTTPEADRVQEVLAEMVADGVETAILEVSSHALALDRVRGCEFDLAIFTNLSPEHLNFHGTMDEYAQAKARLFAMLGEPSAKAGPRFGIVNADDPASAVMREHCPTAILTYGIEQPADVMARDVRLGVRGATFRLVTPRGEAQVVVATARPVQRRELARRDHRRARTGRRPSTTSSRPPPRLRPCRAGWSASTTGSRTWWWSTSRTRPRRWRTPCGPCARTPRAG